MKKIFYLLAMFTAVFLIDGCTDLDEELKGDFTEASEDGGNGGGETAASADGAFSKLFDAGTANHGNFFSIQEVSSDEVAE